MNLGARDVRWSATIVTLDRCATVGACLVCPVRCERPTCCNRVRPLAPMPRRNSLVRSQALLFVGGEVVLHRWRLRVTQGRTVVCLRYLRTVMCVACGRRPPPLREGEYLWSVEVSKEGRGFHEGAPSPLREVP